MRQPVSQVVRELLGNRRLPDKRFAALCNIAAQHRKSRYPESRFAVMPRWVTAAAVVGVAVIALAVMQYRTVSSVVDVHQQIVDEVAVNHIKFKSLEVNSSDMEEVRAFFNPLNFALIESTLFKDTAWRIIGGRFCTIRGEAAAQLRMQTPDGRTQTVYLVPYNHAVHHELPDVGRNESPHRMYSRGLQVRLWRERGLLFAAAAEEHASF